MGTNWANNLDMLAQNGVLDFDAPAYVTGQKPRYVGAPAMPPSPFAGPVPQAQKLNQPKTDEFKPENNNDNNFVKNPAWKKCAFAALAIGAVVLGGWKFKSKLLPSVKSGWTKLTSKCKWNSIKTFCSDKAKAVGKYFKDGWNKLFKKKTP